MSSRVTRRLAVSSIALLGWQCFEDPGVGPYWIGDDVKQSAIDYAKARTKFGRAEIRLLKQDGSVESVIGI